MRKGETSDVGRIRKLIHHLNEARVRNKNEKIEKCLTEALEETKTYQNGLFRKWHRDTPIGVP